MKICANEKLLVLRFSTYKNYDFIEEHRKVINTVGSVWMLKIGKPVPNNTLAEIQSSSAGLILKAPKAAGGKYYYSKMIDSFNSMPTDGMEFPRYYEQLMEDMYWLSMDGTWIRVDEFVELTKEEVLELKLLSNNRPLDEVLSQTRTTMLYAYASADILRDNFGEVIR